MNTQSNGRSRIRNIRNPRRAMWLPLWLAVFFCRHLQGQISGTAVALDPARAKLYDYISSVYSLTNTNTPVYAGKERDLAKLAKSNDPFVKRIAQQCLECIDIDKNVAEKFSQIEREQEKAASEGEPVAEGAKALGAMLNDDYKRFGEVMVNSGTVERLISNGALQREAAAKIGQIEAGVRRSLVTDSGNHPRGAGVSSKMFTVELTNRAPMVDRLVVRMRNNTGSALHNCLLVANVEMDGRKVDAEEKANAASETIASGLERILNPSNTVINAQTAGAQATDKINRLDQGGVVFAAEWPPGQWMETKLVYNVMLRFAKAGELNLANDEGNMTPIILPLEEMTAACVRTLPAPIEVAKTPEEQRADEETMKKQRESVTETGNEGIVVYEFLSYPGVWSEAIVPPPGATGFSVRWADGMKIKARVNGRDMPDPVHFACNLGDRLRFMSVCGEPVPTAVRIPMRKLTPEEKQAGFVMPPWPPPPAARPPARQAMFDDLASVLRKSPAFTGSFFQDNKKYNIEADLSWDARAQFVSGWVDFPELKVKKQIEGRIVDDGNQPLYLQLTETVFLEKPRVSNALLGMYYSLNLDTNNPGQLTGRWQHNVQNIGRKGRIKLQSAAP